MTINTNPNMHFFYFGAPHPATPAALAVVLDNLALYIPQKNAIQRGQYLNQMMQRSIPADTLTTLQGRNISVLDIEGVEQVRGNQRHDLDYLDLALDPRSYVIPPREEIGGQHRPRHLGLAGAGAAEDDQEFLERPDVQDMLRNLGLDQSDDSTDDAGADATDDSAGRPAGELNVKKKAFLMGAPQIYTKLSRDELEYLFDSWEEIRRDCPDLYCNLLVEGLNFQNDIKAAWKEDGVKGVAHVLRDAKDGTYKRHGHSVYRCHVKGTKNGAAYLHKNQRTSLMGTKVLMGMKHSGEKISSFVEVQGAERMSKEQLAAARTEKFQAVVDIGFDGVKGFEDREERPSVSVGEVTKTEVTPEEKQLAEERNARFQSAIYRGFDDFEAETSGRGFWSLFSGWGSGSSEASDSSFSSDDDGSSSSSGDAIDDAPTVDGTPAMVEEPAAMVEGPAASNNKVEDNTSDLDPFSKYDI